VSRYDHDPDEYAMVDYLSQPVTVFRLHCGMCGRLVARGTITRGDHLYHVVTPAALAAVLTWGARTGRCAHWADTWPPAIRPADLARGVRYCDDLRDDAALDAELINETYLGNHAADALAKWANRAANMERRKRRGHTGDGLVIKATPRAHVAPVEVTRPARTTGRGTPARADSTRDENTSTLPPRPVRQRTPRGQLLTALPATTNGGTVTRPCQVMITAQ